MVASRRFNSNFDTSSLGTYFREIGSTPLLTAEQEQNLAHQIANGDQNARHQMVRANLRLVINVARYYAGQGMSMEDLIEEGNVGLMRAVDRFDPSRKIRFSTYAVHWIKQAIRQNLTKTGRTIRIPSYMVDLLGKWRRISNRLQVELGRDPREEEVADEMQLSDRKLDILRRALRLQETAPLQNEEDGHTIGMDYYRDETVTDLDEETDGEHCGKLHGLLDRLKEREAAVLRLRFGLQEQEPQTLQQVGARLGVSRERVRQIEQQAIRNLRAFAQAG